jgi:CIC family chloride channel protein
MKPDLSSDYSLRGFRRRLANIEALPQFAILGVASGVVTGLIILMFRSLIEIPLAWLLPGSGFEDFENLSAIGRFLLPVSGGLLLAGILIFIPARFCRVGVTHVLERLSLHQGHLPLGNALVQFFAGSLALMTGQSVGREGPAIHLGAAGSSLIGQYLKLPHNSTRVLVGCGVAGAISASFNTPLAGVIFSMEVILMEYTMAGFIPVILSAVTANLIGRLVYGDQFAFDVPQISMNSLYDIPYILLQGFVLGILAALFIKLVHLVSQYAPERLWHKMILAGTITGSLALGLPEVMGVGYDTVNSALTGQLSLTLLAAICLGKLVTSAASIGLGVPAGLIGPTMFIGAAAGGIFGVVGVMILPEHVSSPGFYVLMGMGAMMGAVLQAPLSALLAVMELSQNPGIILPAMLVIVVSNLTTSQIFGHRSIFLSMLNIQGLQLRHNPLSVALNHASVASIMERRFIDLPNLVAKDKLMATLAEDPVWLLVQASDSPSFVMLKDDLTNFLNNNSDTIEHLDLSLVPVIRRKVAPIQLQATLSEALMKLNQERADALYVHRGSDDPEYVEGVLTRQDIESEYQL